MRPARMMPPCVVNVAISPNVLGLDVTRFGLYLDAVVPGDGYLEPHPELRPQTR